MVEKKETVKKTTVRKTAGRATTSKKSVVKAEIAINAESVGFRAGDVYQALATAKKSLSVSEIAKNAKLSEEEVLLGMGWLFKEGKIKEDGKLITLA